MAGTTVRSRRLAGLLKEYRRAAGLRQAEVAKHLGRTNVWVSRQETPATCRISVGDVRSLLALYGITDPAEIDRAVQLAIAAREHGWWHGYNLSEMLASFIALESEATSKRVWEAMFIPGLLQTEAYARAVIAAGPEPLTPEHLEGLVQARMLRQKILHRENPLLLHAIMDEAALARGAGDREVMAAQLEHLAEVAAMPNVLFQVLPFSAGLHPGMTGSLAILEFPDPADHDVLYAETPAGSMYVEDEADIRRNYRAFAHLIAMSLSPRDTMSLIGEYAAGL